MANIIRNDTTVKIPLVIDRPDTPEVGSSGNAFTEVLLYKEGNLLTPVASNPTAGQYSVSITSEIGATARVKSDFKTVYISQMIEDFATIEITVNAEGKSTLLRYLTATKVVEGTEGRSLIDTTTEYYLSTNKKVLEGGEWDEQLPLWEAGTYIWTRHRLRYINPTSIEYTTPVCDTSWEQMYNEIQDVYYEVSSRIEQTNTSLKVYFEEAGGYNLLKDTAFNRELKANWTCTEGIVTIDNSRLFNEHNSLRILTSTTDVLEGFSQQFLQSTSTYKNYCFTFWYYIDSGIPFNGNLLITIDSLGGVLHEVTYKGEDLIRGDWIRESITFTIPKNSEGIALNVNVDSVATIWFADMVISEGSSVRPWSPNPAEVYDGIVTLDKDGIEVTMLEGGNTFGSSRLSYDGLTIFDNVGDVSAYFGKDESIYVKSIRCDEIISPSIDRVAKALPNDMYVAPYIEDGVTPDGLSIATAFTSLNELLIHIKDKYGSVLAGNLTIHVSNGVYIEDVNLTDFSGQGTITISLGETVLIEGMWNIICTCIVHITGGRTSLTTNDGAVLKSNNSTYHFIADGTQLTISNLILYNYYDETAASNDCIYSCNNATVHITNCDFFSYTYGLIANNAKGSMYNCSGIAYYAAYALAGGNIQLEGALPCRSIDDNYYTNSTQGGAITEKEAIATNPAFDPLFHPALSNLASGTSVNKKFYLQDVHSIYDGNRRTDGYFAQGISWDNDVLYQGYATIPTTVGEFCSKLNNLSITLTMKKHDKRYGKRQTYPYLRHDYNGRTYHWEMGVVNPGGTVSKRIPDSLLNGILEKTTTMLYTDCDWYEDYTFFQDLYLTITGTLK